jgi:hypothetical protein
MKREIHTGELEKCTADVTRHDGLGFPIYEECGSKAKYFLFRFGDKSKSNEGKPLCKTHLKGLSNLLRRAQISHVVVKNESL